MAHRCFADLLSRRGQFGKAIPHYFMALRVEPDGIETLNNFALRLGAGEDEALRDYPMAIKFAERGCRLTDWKDPKLRHTLALAYTNYAVSFSRRGDFARAMLNFQRASEAEPGFDVPIYNLALLLLSCPKEDLRQPQRGAEWRDSSLRVPSSSSRTDWRPSPRPVPRQATGQRPSPSCRKPSNRPRSSGHQPD